MKRRWSKCPDFLRKSRVFKRVIVNPYSKEIFLGNYYGRGKCNWFIWVRRDKVGNCVGCDLSNLVDCSVLVTTNIPCKQCKNSVIKRVLVNDIAITEDNRRFRFVKTDDVHMEAIKT